MLEHHTVQLDDIMLHYAQAPGGGTPLVLLHGLTGSLETYLPLVPELAEVNQLYLLDLRGHGQSGRAAGAYRVADYAGDVLAFVDRVVGRPAVIVGHSLGALTAAGAAARDTGMVRGVVLEDPPMYVGRWPHFPETGFHQYFTALRRALTIYAETGSLERLADELGQWDDDEGQTLREALGEDGLRALAERHSRLDPETLDAATSNSLFDGFDPDVELPKIACPALLLAGRYELGGAMMEADARRVASLIPRCTLSVFADLGHDIHGARPAEYVAALRSFLAALGDD